MSENLSGNTEPHRKKRGFLSRLRHKKVREKRHYHWRMAMLIPLWVALAFLVSNVAVSGILLFMDWVGHPLDSYLRPAVYQTSIAVIIYSISIATVIGVPYLVKKRVTSLETLGLSRLLSWSDIGLSPAAFVVYMLLVAVTLGLITNLLPAFPIDEVQDVGFKAFGSQADNILAFVTLVVLAPIAEEVLFRGYLYGKLKKHVPVVLAAIITSLMFGLAHFQWNVAVDVFVLSLVLCGLRSLTGSIWAGILVHMIKNGIAFYILFLSPIVGA